jgi:starch phosphorylase
VGYVDASTFLALISNRFVITQNLFNPKTMSSNNTVMVESSPSSDSLPLKDIASEIDRHLKYTLGVDPSKLDSNYALQSAIMSVRDRLMTDWSKTRSEAWESDKRNVHYISLEFLIGRSLQNAVLNLDLQEELKESAMEHGMTLEEIYDAELDAGLGNGGLGRLAACFLDSCANLELPVTGYGIRYEFGMFHQRFEAGHQVEAPDNWLRDGNHWEVERSEDTREIRFYGHTERCMQDDGTFKVQWVGTNNVLAVPYDMPIPGYRNGRVNTLRLWKASATDAFNLGEFNAGSYTEAVGKKINAEQISMVLYPNDSSENGKELRLKQQYFLVSATLQDILQKWVSKHGEDFTEFGGKNCFQLNDTHPACAVPELMRLLMDEHAMEWEEAWQIVNRCMAYTNHTLLPEALEKWSVEMFSRLLPRLLEIIYEINERFLGEVSTKFPGDNELLSRVSLIEGGHHPHIRMAYVALVGSFSVNGVAQLHTDLLKEGLFSDFQKIWPTKFNNKTNGVTPRRWLSHCNPLLRDLITDAIGDKWQFDFQEIAGLAAFADDKEFQQRWIDVKRSNKERLADLLQTTTGFSVDTSALFDVQVKRIHEYKRQLMNVLHVIHLYDQILRGETIQPRVVIIGGKAAPGYHVAKLIIKLINNVASVINNDPTAKGKLQLIFFPNYRVSSMEVICPATELSEQISTAGKEASGTGNMKFMMNGALTIGTFDGANIEIREKAGAENFFLFGLEKHEIDAARASYNPNALIDQTDELKRIFHHLESGRFSASEPGIFDLLIQGLRNAGDQWMTVADLKSFIDAQKNVGEVYQDVETWNRMSIHNSASSGWFSSDRTIRQYADEIWHV